MPQPKKDPQAPTRPLSSPNRKRASKRVNAPQNSEPAVVEAVGYIRVSTNEQADSGLGLEAQRQKIRAQCEANGWNLLRLHEDAGVTAKHLDRPALRAALDDLRPGRVLVVLKLDRLTRSVRDLGELTELIEEAGADWASVTEKFDTTTASGRLILGIMVQLSQWEREVISERTTDALAVRKSQGLRLGTTPLGYRTVEDALGVKHVEEVEEEMKAVRLARELRGGGLSLRRIAALLDEAGFKTKRGGKWEAMTVQKILKTRYIETIEPGDR